MKKRDTRAGGGSPPSLFLHLSRSLLLSHSLARSLETSIPIFRGDGRRMSTRARRRFLSANAMKCVSLLFFFSFFFFSRLFLESICVRGLCVERLESRHEKFQVRDEMRRRPINDAFEFERNEREREREI